MHGTPRGVSQISAFLPCPTATTYYELSGFRSTCRGRVLAFTPSASNICEDVAHVSGPIQAHLLHEFSAVFSNSIMSRTGTWEEVLYKPADGAISRPNCAHFQTIYVQLSS